MNISKALIAQAATMLQNGEDWVVSPDGVDEEVYMVASFPDGAWLCEHHDECVLEKFTRVLRLA